MFTQRALEEEHFNAVLHLSDEIGIHFQKFNRFLEFFATFIRRNNIPPGTILLSFFVEEKKVNKCPFFGAILILFFNRE